MRSRLAIAVVIMVAALTILFAAPVQETAGEVTTVAPPTTVAPEPKARVEVERSTTTSTTAPVPTSPPTTPVTTVPETVPPTTAAPVTAPPVTAAPAPPPPAPTGGIEGIIYAAAAEFGVSGDFMVCVARRESTLNPLAVNSSSGAMGLFQHLPQYWGARAAALGYGYDSWSDPTANARVSAWLLQTSGPSHWASTAAPC